MMSRYFVEVGYMGKQYAGFQVQQNANTVQAEVEKALMIYFKTAFQLTGSSRTDAGVHAFQNYFHFDFDTETVYSWPNVVYHLNAILPADIVIRDIRQVNETAHCRFDAVSRTYQYSLYRFKDPFLNDRAYYYPYKLDISLLNEAASLVKAASDFEAFAKRNSQVHTYLCTINESDWIEEGNMIRYQVNGNRFLRGMVRGLVGTMLRVGNKKISLDEFAAIIESRDSTRVDFSVPAHGLTLASVLY